MFAVALVLAAPGVCAEDVPAAGAEARFGALDANADGVVSRYEYDGDTAFAAMDANHDRHISAEELAGFLGDSSTGDAAAQMVVADLDADGALDQNEAYRAVELRFRSLDRNGDGNLDRGELAAGLGVRARLRWRSARR